MSKLRSVLKRKNLACHGYGIIERIIGQALRFRKTSHIAGALGSFPEHRTETEHPAHASHHNAGDDGDCPETSA